MTMPCEKLATPSERLLRVGEEEEAQEVDAAYAKALAVLLAAREADRYWLGLSTHFAVFGAGLQPFANASTQYVSVDDPRRVIFDTTIAVSGSALASAAIMAISGGVAVLGGYGQFPAPVVRPPFSLYGSPIEGFGQVTDPAPYASAVLGDADVEWLAIGGEALSAMDQASAEYRSRRAEARAEERRLRRYDRE